MDMGGIAGVLKRCTTHKTLSLWRFSAREPDRLDLGYFGTVHLSSSENRSCMKFLAEGFNRPKIVACFKTLPGSDQSCWSCDSFEQETS
jgi:hypothetical protein